MALDSRKYARKHTDLLRDVRPFWIRAADKMITPHISAAIFFAFAVATYVLPIILIFSDVLLLLLFFFFLWLRSRPRTLAFKLPASSKHPDKNNEGPGRSGKAEGIMYLGNMQETKEEIWFTNSDCRTHILYLGTTGSGKTEGLKSIVTNAMSWGSGFVYVDGKADTDLWSSLSALCRRFGRDDDLLVLNYMTGNSDGQAPSNTMNPFSSGSASYLTNMLVQLMPDAEGDNAMWKERAVSLVSAMLPMLVWKRDNQEMPLSVITIRDHLSINFVIKLSRDQSVPDELKSGLIGYLDTLPGFNGDAYDDEGKIKPPDGSGPPPDTTTASQQHGYLAMQFTRALQSLGDDYGYIFDTQAADVDMMDVVLNRRILIVLIPALEKSGDEIANLGKIVASTMKGMMGSTLGATVEGESSKVIENKPTHSSTPFVTVFDEVGYYTAQGMAVMAAQARSLGFCLVFSGQDLPAMKKRVREEAQSITANCNIKIFGKLEDPTETKEFFEKTVGEDFVTELSGYKSEGGSGFYGNSDANIQSRAKASYDGLKSFKEGEAVVSFGSVVIDSNMFYSNPGHAKAMRVSRYLALPPLQEEVLNRAADITKLRDILVTKGWTAKGADVAIETEPEIKTVLEGLKLGIKKKVTPVEQGIMAVVHAFGLDGDITTPADLPPPTKTPATATDTTKKTEPKIETPKEDKPAAPPPTEAEAQSTSTKDSASPLSFFKDKDEGDEGESDNGANNAAPAPEAATTITTDTIETAPEPSKPKFILPKTIANILIDAGKKARKAIFKDDGA